jgi:outer membrane murein-binding lipoprotein Lpp
MSDLSKLSAEVAALSTKLDAFVAASAPSDQAAVDNLTTPVRTLSTKVERVTAKAGEVVVVKAA